MTGRWLERKAQFQPPGPKIQQQKILQSQKIFSKIITRLFFLSTLTDRLQTVYDCVLRTKKFLFLKTPRYRQQRRRDGG